jgi:hypothetical protein
MNMKGQDVLVSLKILVSGWPGSYADLAKSLGISDGGAHQAVKRAAHSGLLDMAANQANKGALVEFLVHGVKYAFPAERGSLTRGMPTSYAVEPLASEFTEQDDDIPVWPDPEGQVRGYALTPLYRSVPFAAKQDNGLYEWLALVDAVRSGRARERDLAGKIIQRRLKS